MAVSFTALATATASTTNQSTAYAGTAGTPAAGDLLVCFVVCSGNTTVGTLAGTFTWNLYTSFTKNAGADIVSVWWAAATTATSTTPSYTPSAAATGCIISCVRVTGTTNQTNGSSALAKAVATNTGSTANPTVTFSGANLVDNGVLVFGTNGTNNTTQWTAPTGFTEISQVAYNTPANSGQTAFRSSGSTATTLTWTNANTTAWATIGLEFTAQPTTSFDPMGRMGFFGL